MADWEVTARVVWVDDRPACYYRVNDGLWQGPQGETFSSVEDLERVHGPSQPAQVTNVHELIAEAALLGEAVDRLAVLLGEAVDHLAAERDRALAQLEQARAQLRPHVAALELAQAHNQRLMAERAGLWRACRAAQEALAITGRNCDRHGTQLRDGAACCVLPAAVRRALAAIEQAGIPGQPNDSRGTKKTPAPAGAGTTNHEEN